MRKILIVLVLISSGSVITDAGSFVAKLAVNALLLSCLLLVTARYLRPGNFDRVVLVRFFLLFSAVLLVLILNGSVYNQGSVTLLFKLLCSGMLATYISKNFDRFFGDYVKVINYIIVLSLVLHVTSILLPGILLAVPGFMDQGKGYLTLLGIQYYPPGDNLFRNAAFFWEPGVFSFFIMLAVLYQLRQRKYPSPLLVAGVISTGSLGGFFILLTTVLLKHSVSVFRRPLITVGIIAVALFLFGGYFFDAASYLSSAFFNRPLTGDQSFAARQVDFYYPFVVALDSPFYGFGMNELSYYVASASADEVTGQVIITNSWGIVAYCFGYFVLGLFLYMLWTSSFLAKSGVLNFIPLYLMFSHEPLVLSVMAGGIVLAYETKAGRGSVRVWLRGARPRRM